jgi:nucleoside-diphosphate-sugar epimerase
VATSRDGTRYYLEAATDNMVKKIIFTNSIVAIVGPGWKKTSHTYDEKDYCPMEETQVPFTQGKISQDLIVEDFLK